MKHIKFAQQFDKLDQPVFTTIRKYKKGFLRGMQVEVRTPRETFTGTITNKVKIRLDNLPPDFLMADCEVETPEDAFKLLKKCHPKLGFTDKVLVMWIQNDKKVQELNEQEASEPSEKVQGA